MKYIKLVPVWIRESVAGLINAEIAGIDAQDVETVKAKAVALVNHLFGL